MATDLTYNIVSITEPDYDEVNETVKCVEPLFNGESILRTFIRDDAETDADSKTAVKAELTDMGYMWDTEEGA